MFSASSRKSSSSTICSANSSTRAGGLASAAIGMRPTRNGPSHDSARRSARTSCATRGRWTLTTTSSPVRSRAACTWAIDAAAMGSSANSEKIVSSGRPKLGLDHGPHLGEPLGRHLVAQLLELVDQLVGEEALERGDDLAELHVGGAEPLELPAQAARDARTRRRGPPLLHVPRPDGRADGHEHPAEAADRRDPAVGEQPRHLGPGAGPDPVEAPLPDQPLGVDDPRARPR